LAMLNLEYYSHSPGETQQLGHIIGRMARPGDIILLSGPLGAGKTCLTQGIAQGLGVKETAASPSYVLMRELQGRLPLYHMDLYRLEFAEIGELGLDDYLYGRGVCVIEWAEKAGAIMPPEHLMIELAYCGECERRIEIMPSGTSYEKLVRHIAEALNSLKKDIE
jgi:tRNA threonylcarbamoyladenosine biosynthesis protein TsaE